MPDVPAVMLAAYTMTLDSPALGAAGIGIAAGAILLAGVRRAWRSRVVDSLLILGLVLLAIAAAGPGIVTDAPGPVAVMVDVSSSTRGATYRDPEQLRVVVAKLLDGRPHTMVQFGDDAEATGETVWKPPPPDASAALLFSDGRFVPPKAAPPVYAVIDPALEHPGDAAVTLLERHGDRVIATASNESIAARELSVGDAQVELGRGTRTVAAPATAPSTLTAKLDGGDAWPENDALTLSIPPPALSERWWVGGNARGSGWRSIDAAHLPDDPSAWLAPSIVVLENVAGNAISPAQAERLHQYVRDLGGGLLIIGGDRAFAAGGYDGTVLGALSPLASNPPKPAAHWAFLIDASGSMASQTNGGTRLAAAVAAARTAIDQLPPNDVVSLAGFSDELRWWLRGTAAGGFSLPDVPHPRGPTNLEAALKTVIPSLDPAAANQLVLVTDGQVELPSLEELAKKLKAAGARVHVFAIGDGKGLPLLQSLANATGGTYAREADVSRWAAGLVAQLRQVSPRYWNTTAVEVRFSDLPAATASSWNRTWVKPGAGELAQTVGDANGPAPMAARMNVGSGQVVALAFQPPDGHIEALAALVQSPPRDPRLTVAWRTGRRLVVDVDAGTLNGLAVKLALSAVNGRTQTFDVPQTAPGRYVLSLPAPRAPTLATLSESGRVIDRFAVAARYAAEFDGIGNDRAALKSLAARTGGRVIEPDERAPPALPAPRRIAPTGHYFALAGALLVGLGLVAWRINL